MPAEWTGRFLQSGFRRVVNGVGTAWEPAASGLFYCIPSAPTRPGVTGERLQSLQTCGRTAASARARGHGPLAVWLAGWWLPATVRVDRHSGTVFLFQSRSAISCSLVCTVLLRYKTHATLV